MSERTYLMIAGSVAILLVAGAIWYIRGAPVRAVRHVVFLREPKTHLCFAAGNAGGRDAFAFSWLPCDQIPPGMIQDLPPED